MDYQEIPNENTYSDNRYDLLLGLEESGSPSLLPYVDPVGVPTIGAGFNLTDNFILQRVFATLDIGVFGASYGNLDKFEKRGRRD